MAGGALLHEFGEDAGMVGLFPFLGNMVEDAFPLRFALPVRNDLALVRVYVFLRNIVLLQLPRIQHMEVLHAVTGELREGGHRLGLGAAFAHDEFVRADIERLLGADLIEVLGAEHRNGVFAVILLVESGFY